jgi:hypothetical protein
VHFPEYSSSFLRIDRFPTNRRTSLLRHVNVPDRSDSAVCFGRAARQLHPFEIRPALLSARSLTLAGVREVLVDASYQEEWRMWRRRGRRAIRDIHQMIHDLAGAATASFLGVCLLTVWLIFAGALIQSASGLLVIETLVAAALMSIPSVIVYVFCQISRMSET